MRTKFVLFLVFLSLNGAQAQILKNTDFSNGRTSWQGTAGKVVMLDDNQQPVKSSGFGASKSSSGDDTPAPKAFPQLEVVLKKNGRQDIKQKLNIPQRYDQGCKITVVLKVAEDSVSKESDPDHPRWLPIYVSMYEEATQASPNRHTAGVRGVEANGHWQTIELSVGKLNRGAKRHLELAFPVGSGTVWVKSIEATLYDEATLDE